MKNLITTILLISFFITYAFPHETTLTNGNPDSRSQSSDAFLSGAGRGLIISVIIIASVGITGLIIRLAVKKRRKSKMQKEELPKNENQTTSEVSQSYIYFSNSQLSKTV